MCLSLRLRNPFTSRGCACTLFSLVLVLWICKLVSHHCYCTSQLLWKMTCSITGSSFCLSSFDSMSFSALKCFMFYEVPCRSYFMIKNILSSVKYTHLYVCVFIYIYNHMYICIKTCICTHYFCISTWSIGPSVPEWITDPQMSYNLSSVARQDAVL